MLNVLRFANNVEQKKWCLLSYGLYMTTNALRGLPADQHNCEAAAQQICQHIRQGADGHCKSSRFLAAVWTSSARTPMQPVAIDRGPPTA
eukprot:7683352-Heterocapsa_arctica.AAC.1